MAEDHLTTTSSPEDGHSERNRTSPKKPKRTRTRTGCLNCRRKKRKCDEGRPSCGACSRRRETCHWGVKVIFRPENAQAILDDHPSMNSRIRAQPHRFEIMDITNEVIRDYHFPSSIADHDSEGGGASPCPGSSPGYGPSTRRGENEVVEKEGRSRRGTQKIDSPPNNNDDRPPAGSARSRNGRPLGDSVPVVSPPSSSQVATDNAVANLLYFSQGGGSTTTSFAVGEAFPKPPMVASSAVDPMSVDPLMLNASPHFDPGLDLGDQLFTPDGSYEDGIFLPGSTYHHFHALLRNHLIQEVKSDEPTRPGSPEMTTIEPRAAAAKPVAQVSSTSTSTDTSGAGAGQIQQVPSEPSSDHEPPYLSPEEECALWKNWIDEISPWLDKFDNERHFQHALPDMARSHDHLRYSMLALSARQLELRDPSRATDLSLALYQEAIHLLLPQLSTRATPVIASCCVLCVLEMCSCSPKAWRRHLDGCASLMKAVGITGFTGGVEQALFWCFARIDVCGGLISSVKTLIPTGHWAASEGHHAAHHKAQGEAQGEAQAQADLDADVARFKTSARTCFTMWANYSVYLCAQVLDLLAPLAKANPGGLFFEGPRSDIRYRVEWLRLWRHVEEWHAGRPSEMRHVMAIPSAVTAEPTCTSTSGARHGTATVASPFPAILYSNAAAISGNQTYHTASLLMLQNRPSSLRLSPKPRSALWHARQICGISITNHHHGAWTNCIQPLWIAGRCMSHPAEHRAILDLLAKIERESGWSTKWRADDLQEFWGELGDGSDG